MKTSCVKARKVTTSYFYFLTSFWLEKGRYNCEKGRIMKFVHQNGKNDFWLTLEFLGKHFWQDTFEIVECFWKMLQFGHFLTDFLNTPGILDLNPFVENVNIDWTDVSVKRRNIFFRKWIWIITDKSFYY